MDIADEIRRWRQARRNPPGLPLVASVQRIAVAEHEVLVVRRRAPRLMAHGRPERSSGQ